MRIRISRYFIQRIMANQAGGVLVLYDKLFEYGRKGVTPMHMPGHKRNAVLLGDTLPYGIDITEIDGFDNLHDAHGVLKETADIAAELYGSRRSFLLVNGSTGGILAAVRSAVRYGDQIIMARNCHKSVYNAIEINGLRPIYVMPEINEASGICGSIKPEQVQKAINDNPDAKLIIITSPTYEGVVSDIKTICEIAHQKNIPVLVDSAHGAHFGFSGFFPCDAVRNGADLVITSLHKTLPALTQCALAHLGGDLVDENRLSAELAIFQTSSPSYVLLSSIDQCLRLLFRDKEILFGTYIQHIKAFDARIAKLEKLKILCHGSDVLSHHESIFDFDPGKIVISTGGTDISGNALAQQLRSKYQIELEMAYCDYAIAITSICDSGEAFEKLADALLEIDSRAEMAGDVAHRGISFSLPQQILTASVSAERHGDYVPLSEAEGCMSLEYVWVYPPGIPFIVPGEIINNETIRYIRQVLDAGIAIKSTKGYLPVSVYCTSITNTCL